MLYDIKCSLFILFITDTLVYEKYRQKKGEEVTSVSAIMREVKDVERKYPACMQAGSHLVSELYILYLLICQY